MHTDSEVLSFVEAFGPTLVLLFAVSLIALTLQKGWKSSGDGPRTAVGYKSPLAPSHSGLSLALEDAVNLNQFDAHARNDPDVRLGALVRFEPSEYQATTHEVARYFREGNVISIDLTAMNSHQAARLVDFCSGMAAVSSGWIFRVTDKAIVLNPPS